MDVEEWRNDDWHGKTEQIQKKTAAVPLHLAQISHKVTND
jgi:hypothetical protein